jgi:uncharacterized protein (TIGR02118 family)
MTRFLAIYRLPEDAADAARFETAYRSTHLPLVAATPGLTGVEVSRVTSTVVGSPSLLLLAVMTFSDEQAMQDAFRTPQWRESGRNLAEIGGLELATMVTLGEPEAFPLTTGASSTDPSSTTDPRSTP